MCQAKTGLFFAKFILQDETWVQHYDPETKGQSKLSTLTYHPQRGTRHILCRQGHAHSLLGATWSSDDGFLGKRQYNYKSLLRGTINAMRRGMLTECVCLLQHDAPVHESHITQTEVRPCGYDVLILLILLTFITT